MRVLELELQNFGPHEYIHATDLQDIVGVLGRNGTGKSHVITAIKALLLGDLEGQSSSWVKASTNKDGTVPKFAWLRGKFEINGQICEIERKISAGKTGNTRSLKLNGGTPITKAKDVDKAIEDVIGVDKYTIANTLFAAQGEISQILECSDSERIKLFTKWFNLGFLSKQYDWLSAKVQELEKSIVPVAPLKDLLASNIASQKQMEVNINETQSQLESKYISETLITEFPKKYHVYKAYVQATQEVERTVAYLRDEEKRILSTHNCSSLEELQSKLELLTVNNQESQQLLKVILEAERQYNNIISDAYCWYALYRISKLDISKSYTNVKDLHALLRTIYLIEEFMLGFESKVKEIYKDWDCKSEYDSQLAKINISITETNKQLVDLRSKQMFTKQQLKDLRDTVANLKQLKVKLETDGSVQCPYCKSTITQQEHLDAEIERFGLQVKQQKSYLEQLDKCVLNSEEQQHWLASERTRLEDLIRNLTIFANQLQAKYAMIEPYLDKQVMSDIMFDNNLWKLIENLRDWRLNNSDVCKSVYTWETLTKQSAVPYGYDRFKILDKLQLEDLEAWFGSYVDGDLKSWLSDKNMLSLLNSTAFTQIYTNYTTCPVRNIQECNQFKEFINTEISKAEANKQTLSLDLHSLKRDKQLLAAAEEQIRKLSNETEDANTPVDEFKRYLEHLREIATEEQKQELLLMSGSPEQTIEVLQQVQIKYQNLKVEIATYNRMQLDIERNKEKIETLEKENEGVYKQLMELQQILNYLNPKQGGSKQYIRYMFSYILQDVQHYLEAMNSTFIVDIDNEVENDLAFKFKPLDKDVWLPMKKLSGGQKITLSIAFLLAIQNVVCPGLGFLVLDEPSTHLDVQSREALCHLVERIGLTLNSAHGQLWLIDHDEILERPIKTKIII